MTNSSLLRKIVFALSVVFFVSCDTDFNEIGADIIQDDIHHNNIDSIHGHIVAYDRATGPVQANNLPNNSLGYYNNPVFGKTNTTFVTQVALAVANPSFINPVIDSVYMYVPYYSKLISTDETGKSTYQLDSVYGNPAAKMRLRIYENGYFLRNSDPGTSFTTGQKYYSSDKSLVDTYKGEMINTDADVAQNDEFVFSAEEVQRKAPQSDGVLVVKERMAPGMFLYLKKDFFQRKVLNAPAGKLINDNVFKDYFRGLYFDISPAGDDGAMAMAQFNKGTITIKYTDFKVGVDGNATTERVKKTLTINLAGNTINFFDNTYNAAFNNAITTFNEATGDNRLYIKGGEGSMGVLNILSDADIAFLKQGANGPGKVLINEANLSFYIDKAAMAGAEEPLRIYLYDINNQRPLTDYTADISSNKINTKYDKVVHGGLIQYDTDGRGLRYKIRLTDHINNIINRDSTNVKLGLVITEHINLVGNAALKTPFTAFGQQSSTVPAASVISPLGTILYGTGADVPADKKLKLEIFYTKPN